MSVFLLFFTTRAFYYRANTFSCEKSSNARNVRDVL